MLEDALRWSLACQPRLNSDLFEEVHDDVGERKRILRSRKGHIGHGEPPRRSS
jgi:hypothetical protein